MNGGLFKRIGDTFSPSRAVTLRQSGPLPSHSFASLMEQFVYIRLTSTLTASWRDYDKSVQYSQTAMSQRWWLVTITSTITPGISERNSVMRINHSMWWGKANSIINKLTLYYIQLDQIFPLHCDDHYPAQVTNDWKFSLAGFVNLNETSWDDRITREKHWHLGETV